MNDGTDIDHGSAFRPGLLDGKVALVTGSTRGLGRQMVEAFAAAGAGVVVSSRKAEACEEAAAEIRASTGAEVLPHCCHVARWSEIDELVTAAYRHFGRIDILVNNAGIAPLFPSMGEATEELFDKVIGVNLKGPFRLGAVVGERMVDDGGGVIINVSSVAAMRPIPSEAIYAAAKAGLDSLTASMSLAFGPTVRVNTLMAGPFLTDISRAWDMAAFEESATTYPLQRAGDPREIVGAALFLASALSSFTTGTVLRADGGMGVAR